MYKRKWSAYRKPLKIEGKVEGLKEISFVRDVQRDDDPIKEENNLKNLILP